MKEEEVARTEAVYYNEYGEACDKEFAVSMEILNYDKDGNYLFAVRGVCKKK